MLPAERIVVEAGEVEESTQLEKILNLGRTVDGGIELSAKTKGMRTERLEVTQVDLELIDVLFVAETVAEQLVFDIAPITLRTESWSCPGGPRTGGRIPSRCRNCPRAEAANRH